MHKWLFELTEDLPEDVFVRVVNANGDEICATESTAQSPLHSQDIIVRVLSERSWIVDEWKTQQRSYREMALPLFSSSGEFEGVLFISIPKNYKKELQRLRHDHEVFHWILEISRYVLFESRSEELWSQFRDLFLQLFQVQGGGFLRIANSRVQDFEWFGRFQVPDELRTEMTFAAMTIIENGGKLKSIYFEHEEKVYHVIRYDWVRNCDNWDVLYLFHDPIDDEEATLFLSLMNFYHLAVQVVEQREMLQRKTNEDPLTGVWNRRALESHMETYYALRHPSPAIFVLFDLDHFKQLNDTQGHQTGDIALQEVARYFRTCIRKGDWIARIGGDEWVLVLHEVEPQLRFPQQVREWMESGPFVAHGLGITGGYVEIPQEAVSYQDAYRLADHRLYEGKRGGRNRVVGPNTIVLLTP